MVRRPQSTTGSRNCGDEVEDAVLSVRADLRSGYNLPLLGTRKLANRCNACRGRERHTVNHDLLNGCNMKKSIKADMSSHVPGFAAAGEKIPAGLVHSHLAASRMALVKELTERNSVELEAAKYASKLHKPVARSQTERRELRRLARGLRKRFASQVLKLPPGIPEIPGLLTYSVRLAPKYSFGSIDNDFSGPGNSAFARRSTGEMELRFSNSNNDNLLHFSLVELGGFFFPPAGASHITASANPITAFSWFMDSEGPRVFSDGAIILKITGFKGTQAQDLGRHVIQLWRQNQDEGAEGFQFDLRTAASMPMSANANVNYSDFYLISLRCFSVFATGHPGTQNSEAFVSGSIAVSLPSITLDVRVEPLLSQG